MRKTLRRHRGDPHGARRRWGIENQDHPPSRETITQESGLRENRTSRLSERTEEGRQPDLLRLYIRSLAPAKPGLAVPGMPTSVCHDGARRVSCNDQLLAALLHKR